VIKPLLEIERLSKLFGGLRALDSLSMQVYPGETVGLVGPNGAGKSTLFNILTGFLTSDGGSVVFDENVLTAGVPHAIARLGISRTFQQVRLARQLSVLDNVLLASPPSLGNRILPAIFARRAWSTVEARHVESGLNLLRRFGLGDVLDILSDELSFGQQKLLSLICCIASGARLLLLDEPVAGVSAAIRDRVLDMIAQLCQQGRSSIVIEHDFDFVEKSCQRVLFMDAGRKICEGTPRTVRAHPYVMAAYLQ